MSPINLREQLDDELVSVLPDRDLVLAGSAAGARTLRRRRLAGAGVAAATLAAAVFVPSWLTAGGADDTAEDGQVAAESIRPGSPEVATPDARAALADGVVTSREWARVQERVFDHLLPERFGAVTAAPMAGAAPGDDPVAFTLTTEAGAPRLEVFLTIQGVTGGEQPGASGCAGLRDAARDRGPDLVEWVIIGCEDSDLGDGWRSRSSVELSRLRGEGAPVHGASILTFHEGVWSEAGLAPVGSGPVTITAEELATMSADPLWLDMLEVGSTYLGALPDDPQSVATPALPVWPGAG